jgi:hypothetical protein
MFITLAYLLKFTLTSKSPSLVGPLPPPYGGIPFPRDAMTNIVIDGVEILKGRYLNSTYCVNVNTCKPPKIVLLFTQYAVLHVYCAASRLLCVPLQWFI